MGAPLWLRWLKVYAYGGCIIGTGVLLFNYTTPTDEDIINALSPELRLQYERERGLRRAEQQNLMQIAKETSASSNPIWQTGAIQSPWEKNPSAVKSSDHFEKLKADQVQKEELDRIRKQLAEIREKSEQKTKQFVNDRSWWKLW
ncbi:Cbp4p Ecym_6017 [Eremothecium cymbalariae DBVPG|uniref:Cytochrome b mRNA-processing protein 4 n=1 Tax=Eremothecium cymbalariae (strain CBS 270.75 / DBVPG 7215 / KCTC 17166 / NRRL Y-17582) TaxID=931890 RepID=G8JUU6_ERECY|nr:hypothetical protein Ecym_6017 [Eremothecium cymbalariae DBVPG\